MAVVLPEVAEAGAAEAGAGEAGAAGHSDAAVDELEGRVKNLERKPPTVAAAPSSRTSGGGGGISLPSVGSRPVSSHLGRLVLAAVAFVLALEFVSYVSGRYFQWNLGQGAQKATTAATYLGLYPGQEAKLAASRAQQVTATSPSTGTGHAI